MSKPEGSFCWSWCKSTHEGHHPTIGQEVVIISDLVYGLKDRHGVVVRPTQGTEHAERSVMHYQVYCNQHNLLLRQCRCPGGTITYEDCTMVEAHEKIMSDFVIHSHTPDTFPECSIPANNPCVFKEDVCAAPKCFVNYTEPSNKCPQCHKTLLPNFKFCPYCGTVLLSPPIA